MIHKIAGLDCFFLVAAVYVRRQLLAQRKKYETDANRYGDPIRSSSSSSIVKG